VPARLCESKPYVSTEMSSEPECFLAAAGHFGSTEAAAEKRARMAAVAAGGAADSVRRPRMMEYRTCRRRLRRTAAKCACVKDADSAASSWQICKPQAGRERECNVRDSQRGKNPKTRCVCVLHTGTLHRRWQLRPTTARRSPSGKRWL
jgi:hypothetical protein